MSILRAFCIVVLSGLGFAGAGAIVGLGVGVVSPDYYRVIFRIPPELPLQPVSFGAALGLTQGLLVGLAAGLVIVAAVAWSGVRSGQSRG